MHDFDLSRVRRSMFPDGTNLSAAARAVASPFSSSGTRLEDLPGKWFLTLNVSGKIDAPRLFPRRWYGQQDTSTVSGRRRGPDSVSSPLVPPTLPTGAAEPKQGTPPAVSSLPSGAPAPTPPKRRGLWGRFSSPQGKTPLSPGSDLPSVQEKDTANEESTVLDGPSRRSRRPRAASAGASETKTVAPSKPNPKRSSTTDDLPGGAFIGSPGGSAYDAFGFAPAAGSTLADWYRGAAAAGGRLPTRSKTSALFGAGIQQPFPLRTQQQSMDQRRTCFARPLGGTIRFPVAVPVRLPRTRGFAKNCDIRVQLMYESDRGTVNIATCLFSAFKWLDWTRRRPGGAFNRMTCSTKSLNSPAGALGNITAHVRPTRPPHIFRMCAPIYGTFLSRSFVFQGPSAQRQLVVTEEATEVMFGVQVPCQFLRFRLQHLMQQRELLLLTLQAVLESLPLRVDVSSQDYMDANKDTLKLTQQAKECRRAGIILLPIASKAPAAGGPNKTSRSGTLASDGAASPQQRRRTELSPAVTPRRSSSGGDTMPELHLQRSVSSTNSSWGQTATPEATMPAAGADSGRTARLLSVASTTSTLPPPPSPPAPSAVGAPLAWQGLGAGISPGHSSDDSDDNNVRMSASAFPVSDLSLRWRLQVAKWLRAVLIKFNAAISRLGALVEGYQRLYNHAARYSSRYHSRGMDVLAADDELSRAAVRTRGLMRSAPFFKTSTLKKQPALSALPTNLHLQLLSVEEKEIPLPNQAGAGHGAITGGTAFSAMPGGRTLEDTEGIDCYDMVKAPPALGRITARRPSFKYAQQYAHNGAAGIAGSGPPKGNRGSVHQRGVTNTGWSSTREQVDAAVWGWGSEVGHERRRSSIMRTLYARPRQVSAAAQHPTTAANGDVATRGRTSSHAQRIAQTLGIAAPEAKAEPQPVLRAIHGRGGGLRMVQVDPATEQQDGATSDAPGTPVHSTASTSEGTTSARPLSMASSLSIVGSTPRFARAPGHDDAASGHAQVGDAVGLDVPVLRARLLSEAYSDSDSDGAGEGEGTGVHTAAKESERAASRAGENLRSTSDAITVESSDNGLPGAAPGGAAGRTMRSHSGDEATALTRAGFDPLASLAEDSDSGDESRHHLAPLVAGRAVPPHTEHTHPSPKRQSASSAAKRNSAHSARHSLVSAAGANLREFRRGSDRLSRAGSLALRGGGGSGVAAHLLPPSVRQRDAAAGEALLGGLLEEAGQDDLSSNNSSRAPSIVESVGEHSGERDAPGRSQSHVRIGNALVAAALMTTGGLQGGDVEPDGATVSTSAWEVDDTPLPGELEEGARSGTISVDISGTGTHRDMGDGRRSMSLHNPLHPEERPPAPPRKMPAAPPRAPPRAVDLSAAPSELQFVPLNATDTAASAEHDAGRTSRSTRKGRMSLAILPPPVNTQLPGPSRGDSSPILQGPVRRHPMPPAPPVQRVSAERFEGAITSFRDARACLARRLKSSGDASYCYATVTLGAPAAQAKGFQHGGLYKRRADSLLPGTVPACVFVEHWVSQACSAVLHRLTAESKAVDAMREVAASRLVPFRSRMGQQGGAKDPPRTAPIRRRQKRASILETATAAVVGISSSPGLDARAGAWLGEESPVLEGVGHGVAEDTQRERSGSTGRPAAGADDSPHLVASSSRSDGSNGPASMQWTQAGFAAIDAALGIQEREDDALPQLLAAVVTAFTYQLDYAVAARRLSYLTFLAKAGFLVQIESLLSTAGDENGMLEDFMAVSRLLGRVAFRLQRVGGKDAKQTEPAPSPSPSCGMQSPGQSLFSPLSGATPLHTPTGEQWSQPSPGSTSSHSSLGDVNRSESSGSVSSLWGTGSSPALSLLQTRTDRSGSAVSGASSSGRESPCTEGSTDVTSDASSAVGLVGSLSAHGAAMRLLRVSGVRTGGKGGMKAQRHEPRAVPGSNLLTEWMATNEDEDDEGTLAGTPSAHMRRLSRSMRRDSALHRTGSFVRRQSRQDSFAQSMSTGASRPALNSGAFTSPRASGAAGMVQGSLQREASAIWDAAIDGALEATGQGSQQRSGSQGAALAKLDESRRLVPSLSQGARPLRGAVIQEEPSEQQHGTNGPRRSTITVPSLFGSLRAHRVSTSGPLAQRDMASLQAAARRREAAEKAAGGRTAPVQVHPVEDVKAADKPRTMASVATLMSRRTASGDSILFQDDDDSVFLSEGGGRAATVDVQGRGRGAPKRRSQHDKVAFGALSRGASSRTADVLGAPGGDSSSDEAHLDQSLQPREAALSWFWKSGAAEEQPAHTAAHDIRQALHRNGVQETAGRKLSAAEVVFPSDSKDEEDDEGADVHLALWCKAPAISSSARQVARHLAGSGPSRASQAVLASAAEVNDILDVFSSAASQAGPLLDSRRPGTPQADDISNLGTPEGTSAVRSRWALAGRRRSVSVSGASSRRLAGAQLGRGRRFDVDRAESSEDSDDAQDALGQGTAAGLSPGWGVGRTQAHNSPPPQQTRGRVFSALGPQAAAAAIAATAAHREGSNVEGGLSPMQSFDVSGIPPAATVSIESQLPSGLEELRKLSDILEQRISRKTGSSSWRRASAKSKAVMGAAAVPGALEGAEAEHREDGGAPPPAEALPDHLAALATLTDAEAAAVHASVRTLESMAATSAVLADSGSDLDLDVSSDDTDEGAPPRAMAAPDGDPAFVRAAIQRSSQRLHRITVSMDEYQSSGSLFEREAWHLHKRGAIATTLTAAYSGARHHSVSGPGGAVAGGTDSSQRAERQDSGRGGESHSEGGGRRKGQALGYDPNNSIDTVVPATIESCEAAGMVLDVEVDAAVFDLLPSELTSQQIHIVPVMFTQGINEQQSFVNAVGGSAASIQSMVNVDGTSKLNEYAQQWGALAVGAAMVKLDRDLATLATQVRLEASRPGKHHQVLTIAADITRMLHGARITCCKSGKDRTAMSVTYEEARILRDRHGLPQHNTRPAANLLREQGVRLPVCAKNVGVPVYAFNSLQVALLPKIYKPPSSTIASSGSAVAT